jgi:ATP phosphoribosyltransferase
MDLMRTSQISLNSPRTLSNKLAIIQKLKEAIANRSENAQDEVIFTIFTLSCCDSINITEEKKKPFDSPLKRSEWLKVTSVYGNCTSVPEHKKALFQLITMRGGLEALKLPGLAENIIS